MLVLFLRNFLRSRLRWFMLSLIHPWYHLARHSNTISDKCWTASGFTKRPREFCWYSHKNPQNWALCFKSYSDHAGAKDIRFLLLSLNKKRTRMVTVSWSAPAPRTCLLRARSSQGNVALRTYPYRQGSRLKSTLCCGTSDTKRGRYSKWVWVMCNCTMKAWDRSPYTVKYSSRGH